MTGRVDPILQAWGILNGKPEGVTLIRRDLGFGATTFRLAMRRGPVSVAVEVTIDMQRDMFVAAHPPWAAIRMLNGLYRKLLDAEAAEGGER